MISCPNCAQEFATFRSFGGHAKRCPVTTEQLFWLKVNRDDADACWLWNGALQRDGYAHFTAERKTISSHRYAYELIVGPVPDGLDLLHSCDVRHCVNPAHLRPGTHHENMLEAKAKGRHVHGARNRHAKLSDEQVVEIRAEYYGRRGGSSNAKELAAKYGVGKATIVNAALRRTWSHIK